MGSYIRYEMLLFFQAVLAGAALLLCYDILRAFRRVVHHGNVWVAVEDIFFWIGVGISFFSFICRVNQGILRFFLFLGIFLGVILCALTLSDFFVKIFTRILEIPVVLIKKMIKWLLFPVRRCKLFVYKCVEKERQANWLKRRKKEERKVS